MDSSTQAQVTRKGVWKTLLPQVLRWLWRHLTRRDSLARIAIILLSLTAAWGVYSFSLLMAPWPIAILGALAFEAAYLGLAYLDLTGDRQRQAQHISITAVACSITFNVLAGLFHLQPELLTLEVNLHDTQLWFSLVLTLIHAVPLPLLAFLLANLVIHSPEVKPQEESDIGTVPLLVDTAAQSERRYPCPSCDRMLTQGEYGAAVRRGHCRQCKGQQSQQSEQPVV